MNRELSILLESLAADCRAALTVPRSGRCTAVIGSGPAGLAVSVELARHGHAVQLFEAAPLCGITLLRRPALESSSAAPRSFEPVDEAALSAAVAELASCGIEIVTSAPKGMAELSDLLNSFDAVVCACGKAAVLPADASGRVQEALYAAGTCVKNQKVQDAFQAAQSGRDTARSIHAFLTQQKA
ncbi:NAD(P)-binding protein [Mailhella sp.]|uniref:NAD(P)-binding protein n=1 Tax=Mailhella sp. TaxID=1981029 RepID=UPI004063981F